jgi:hypothetical protein
LPFQKEEAKKEEKGVWTEVHARNEASARVRALPTVDRQPTPLQRAPKMTEGSMEDPSLCLSSSVSPVPSHDEAKKLK